MSEENVIRSGGIDVSGSVNVQGDLVGRDKIIQNIIVVGRVLDFAQVEGLLPHDSSIPDFASISDAFEATFKNRYGAGVTEAIGIAGEILGDILTRWSPGKSSAALSYKRILREIAPILVKRLKEFDYWNNFCEKRASTSWTILSPGTEVEVIWLHSLEMLWKKYGKDEKLYGLATVPRFIESAKEPICIFIVQKGKPSRVVEAYSPSKASYEGYDFEAIGHQEFRIFMTGLIIDIIRLASTASADIDFWGQLVNSLKSANH